MDRGKRIIGIVLIAVSIAALVTWEKWGKAQFLYDEVLVCSKNVAKGTILRDDMFQTVKMKVSEKDFITPGEKNSLVGKEAAAFIHKGLPLFQEYFIQVELVSGAKEGKYVLTVPEEWLYALPSSLRRGDDAYFFLGSGLVTSAPVRLVDKENHSVEIVVTDKQAQQLSKAAESGEKMILVYH